MQFHIIMRMLLNGQRFISPTKYHNDKYVNLQIFFCKSVILRSACEKRVVGINQDAAF